MSNDTQYGIQEQLVPGALRGFRLWKVMPNYTLSPMHMGIVWERGVNKALCAKYPYFTSANHRAPDRNCSCGFYAKYKYSDLQREVHYTEILVAGAIEATGLVLQGQMGFRAEKARILGICPVSNLYSLNEIQQTVRASLEYDVPWFGTMTSLVNDFPEEVVDIPEPEPVEDYPNVEAIKQLYNTSVPSGIIITTNTAGSVTIPPNTFVNSGVPVTITSSNMILEQKKQKNASFYQSLKTNTSYYKNINGA